MPCDIIDPSVRLWSAAYNLAWACVNCVIPVFMLMMMLMTQRPLADPCGLSAQLFLGANSTGKRPTRHDYLIASPVTLKGIGKTTLSNHDKTEQSMKKMRCRPSRMFPQGDLFLFNVILCLSTVYPSVPAFEVTLGYQTSAVSHRCDVAVIISESWFLEFEQTVGFSLYFIQIQTFLPIFPFLVIDDDFFPVVSV